MVASDDCSFLCQRRSHLAISSMGSTTDCSFESLPTLRLQEGLLALLVPPGLRVQWYLARITSQIKRFGPQVDDFCPVVIELLPNIIQYYHSGKHGVYIG
jgi:hypothetical protein